MWRNWTQDMKLSSQTQRKKYLCTAVGRHRFMDFDFMTTAYAMCDMCTLAKVATQGTRQPGNRKDASMTLSYSFFGLTAAGALSINPFDIGFTRYRWAAPSGSNRD